MINLDNVKKTYFIGIGGIGMSALAQLLASRGIAVSGSDISESPVTKKLASRDIKVLMEQKAENITDDIDVVIYTIAIPEDQPELQKAREKNIPVYTYPEMLGLVSSGSYTIAISGTHGKTTTTAMTVDVMVDAGLAPTAIVGSLVSRYNSNFIEGESKYFLTESCEYKRSFRYMRPSIFVITNLEEDHLDYYKDLADIQSAFREVAEKVPADGFVVCNPADPHIAPVIKDIQATIFDYTKMPKLELQVPGAHNIYNAQVAYSVGAILSVKTEQIEKSLKQFSGTWRRFEYRGKSKGGALIFDDYAHHPQEIRVTLDALADKYPDKKKIVVFQPHLFSRTKSFMDDFSKSFSRADDVILAPIYAAREADDPTVSHTKLADNINELTHNARAIESLESIASLLKDSDENTVIMTMGAGDVYLVGDRLLALV